MKDNLEKVCFENIIEVKDVREAEEANQLLAKGWKLLGLKTEKLRVPAGRVEVKYSRYTPKYEPVYEEKIATVYILGKTPCCPKE